MLITSPGFRRIKTETLAYVCGENDMPARLSRLISSLRVRLASSESSQSCPRRAHRVDERVPLMHLLTWDCKAVRCEIPLLRPDWNRLRVDEKMPCEDGATALKGPLFRIPLI